MRQNNCLDHTTRLLIQGQCSKTPSIACFNVGGKKFEVEIETLKRIPTSVLGEMAENGFLESMKNKVNPIKLK